jgi:Na+-translocating ferredoxin:NAD+ oxidoreductase subunit B
MIMEWTDILIATGVMIGLGGLLGLALAFASKKLSVKTDERIAIVTKMLPGLNCGVCGHPGCEPMAIALLDGRQKKVSACRPAKKETHERIVEYINSTPGPDGKVNKVEV